MGSRKLKRKQKATQATRWRFLCGVSPRIPCSHGVICLLPAWTRPLGAPWVSGHLSALWVAKAGGTLPSVLLASSPPPDRGDPEKGRRGGTQALRLAPLLSWCSPRAVPPLFTGTGPPAGDLAARPLPRRLEGRRLPFPGWCCPAPPGPCGSPSPDPSPRVRSAGGNLGGHKGPSHVGAQDPPRNPAPCSHLTDTGRKGPPPPSGWTRTPAPGRDVLGRGHTALTPLVSTLPSVVSWWLLWRGWRVSVGSGWGQNLPPSRFFKAVGLGAGGSL